MQKDSIKNFTYRMDKGTANMLDEIQAISESSTKNSALDKAVKFYYGYLTSSISQDFLCGILGQKLEATQRRNADYISRMLYKVATEMNMLTRVSAKNENLSKDEYDRIRRKAMQDVNRVRGILNLYEVGIDNKSDEDCL